MSISDYLENKVLDKILKDTAFTSAPVFGSLHSGDPGEAGGNEISGGSGPYARTQVAAAGWNAAASGLSDNVSAIVWTGLPAATIVGVGLWDAASAGNFLGGNWLSTIVRVFAVLAGGLAGNTIESPGHGFSNDDRVAFEAEDVGSLPTGISAGTLYWVINTATDTFEISTTQGGGEVDITTVGTGKVRKVVPKTTNLGDSFTINAGDFDFRLF